MRSLLNSLSLMTVTLLLYLSPSLQRSVAAIPAAPVAQTSAKAEADRLYQQGNEQYNRGRYRAALQNYQRVLELRRALGERADLAATLHKLGATYYKLGEHSPALESYDRALEIRRELGDRQGVGSTLNSLGIVYQQLGQSDRALEFHKQALTIHRQGDDKAEVATTLNHIGLVYESQGRYHTALEFDRQALAIFQALGNRKGEAVLLEHIGAVSHRLGKYDRALEFYRTALEISWEIGDRATSGDILHHIGFVYAEQKQEERALEFYRQALAIFEEIGDLPAAGNTLNNIGFTYDRLGRSDKALEVLERALAIFKQLGDRPGMASTLDSLGTVYKNRGDDAQALDFSHRALAVLKEVGDRPGEVIALSNIAAVYEKQERPELAIAFYKQSVNVSEAIRKELRVLPLEEHQFYTETVSETYRHLANLLLQQDRVVEAHHILDLLKVQELHHYLQKMEGNEQTAQGIDLHPQEQNVLDSHVSIQEQAVQLGKELARLEQIRVARRTPEQERRIVELQAAQAEIAKQFNEFINSPEVVTLSQQLNQRTGGETLDLTGINRLHGYLDRVEENVAILHPLILEDRLELILVTRHALPIRRTVAINREELQQAIAKYRRDLVTPRRSVPIIKKKAQQLYNWLIKPIENELKQAEVQTIVYAPDGQLRYLPLAALHDGDRWLVERFRINNITAVTLDDFDGEHSREPLVLAGAFSQGDYSFNVGDREFNFSGLPFAGREVELLADSIENTTHLLDEQFSPQEILPRMNDYHIVHFATHAAFVKGHPEESFILFGNGDRVSLHEIESWSLPDVDLVVLSACQTAVGGILGNGHEILGFGYQIQQTGAKAAIASLWRVDDLGTQVLMDRFYQELQEGNPTKAEALRQAQMALITGKELAEQSNLEHPYYWAPFILIGHGL